MTKQQAKAIAITKQCTNPVLLCITLALLMSYGYLLFMTVAHVVIQKEFAQEQTDVLNKLTSLETEYISVQHKISMEISSSADLVATDEKIYLSKETPSLVLGSRDER